MWGPGRTSGSCSKFCVCGDETYSYDLNDIVIYRSNTRIDYLYCCTLHLADSLNITLPTNALIVLYIYIYIITKKFIFLTRDFS